MREDYEARWLFLAMLIIGDESGTGVVDMPIEALGRRAAMAEADVRKALAVLMAPDPTSFSQKEEGRRIVSSTGNPERGWLIVNWAEYRQIATKEAERERVRKAVQVHRNSPVTKCNAADSDSTPSPTPENTNTRSAAPPLLVLEPTKPKKFQAPTVDEAREYFSARGSGEHMLFLAYYESVGWKVGGKATMKNWKGAAYGWIERNRK